MVERGEVPRQRALKGKILFDVVADGVDVVIRIEQEPVHLASVVLNAAANNARKSRRFMFTPPAHEKGRPCAARVTKRPALLR
jgi:hypothetical protein